MLSGYRRLLLGRLGLAGIAYSGMFVMASTAGVELYGRLAFTIFLVKNVVSFTVGINQGLIYFLLKERGDYFASYIYSYAAIFVLVCIFYGFAYGSLVVILSIALFPIIAIEPYAKSMKNYFVVLYPEVILVVAFLIASLIMPLTGNEYPYYIAEFAVALFAIFSICNLNHLFFSYYTGFRGSKFQWKKVRKLVEQGFPGYLYGVAYFLFILVDRTMIEQVFGAKSMSTIMLAYQFALISGFVVSTMNATAIVRIAEELKGSQSNLLKYIRYASSRAIATNAICLVAVLFVCALLKDVYFSEYENLTGYVLISGVGVLLFNMYGVVSPVLFYYRKQLLPVFLLFFTVVVTIVLYNSNKVLTLTLIDIQILIYLIFGLSMLVSFFYAYILVKNNSSIAPR